MSSALEGPQDLVWAAQCGGCGRLAIEKPYTPVWLQILRREGRLAKTVYLCGNDDCPANDIAGR